AGPIFRTRRGHGLTELALIGCANPIEELVAPSSRVPVRAFRGGPPRWAACPSADDGCAESAWRAPICAGSSAAILRTRPRKPGLFRAHARPRAPARSG